ncbi:MAG: glutamine--fructose-6-phosphate transaminase (isomerizing) [Clostridia bacterium]|nr:glutamine--fructose-6-phosphate transaminase (isomerizing) [Clostridia bacterium]
MCGIFGYIGQSGGINTLIQGLKSLEYRGYDSAGLAYLDKRKEFVVIKRSGKVKELESCVSVEEKFEVGIAHTRWATHGVASETNAHPHISYGKKFCLVHNGIVENYLELKEKYLKNISIKSETDTEIVVHLLEKFYNNNIFETIKTVCKKIQGSYALAIITKEHPDKLFLAKKSSPLMFGQSKNGIFFSSDVNTLSQFCQNFYIMEDEEFACLQKNNFFVFNQNNTSITKKSNSFLTNNQNKKNVECYMEQEILESPIAIKKTIKSFENQYKKIPKNFFKKTKNIYLVGCGTAYHSCLVGKKYLQNCYKVPILTEIASEFIYSNLLINENTLCIFTSQSGETADTLLALKLAKQKGAKILAITNNASSTITFESKYSIVMDAGWEKAVASTKAYVCQIAVFYLLSYYLLEKKEFAKQNLDILIKKMLMLTNNKWAKCTSKIIPKYKKIIFIGRQLSFISAMEASLKLKEVTYINSIACASGELKHGTLALVDKDTLIIAILCEKELIDKNLSTMKEISARDGNLLILSPFKSNINYHCNGKITNLLLPEVQDELYPVLSIIPLQKLACELSKKLGFDPDMPKNLSKSVTVE